MLTCTDKIREPKTPRSSSKLAYIPIVCYVVGLVFYSFDPLMQSFPSIITNELMNNFRTTSIGIGVIASSYYYSYNLMQIPAGILCDRFGARKILLSSLVTCALGLIFFSYSISVNQAVFSRIIMGFGASSAAVLFVIISKQYFNARYLPILIGIGQFTGNLGSICGQYPISMMTDIYGWRHSIILLNLIPVALFILAIFFINKTESEPQNSGKIYSQVKTVFTNKSNWIIGLYAMLLWTPFYTFSSLWGVSYLTKLLHVTTTTSSQIISASWIGSGVGSILLGAWSGYLGKRKICLAVSALIGAIIFPLVTFANIDNAILISILLFIFGLASSGQALSFALINDCNSKENLGMAVGLNNTIIMIGTMLLDPIVGWIVKNSSDAQFIGGLPFYSVSAYNKSFLLIPILFILALLVSFYCQEKPLQTLF